MICIFRFPFFSVHLHQFLKEIDMSKDSKERIQYISACVMLGSGILLTFLCFFLNHYKIEDSVLWYVAQSLVYAGSVFVITMYISTTRREITNFLNDRLGGGKEDRLAKEGTA